MICCGHRLEMGEQFQGHLGKPGAHDQQYGPVASMKIGPRQFRIPQRWLNEYYSVVGQNGSASGASVPPSVSTTQPLIQAQAGHHPSGASNYTWR
jgi:hypothetical protein